jgi:hypothetical protein
VVSRVEPERELGFQMFDRNPKTDAGQYLAADDFDSVSQ